MTTLTSDRLVENKGGRRFLPSLENGDHLTQIEFSEIYRQRPDIKKAELIEGMVFMASPVSLFHGSPHMRFSGLLVQYAANSQKTHWFSLQEGRYVPLFEDEGVLRSKVFPGLWFAPKPFWEGDLKGMLKVLQVGLDSPEHTAFVNANVKYDP